MFTVVGLSVVSCQRCGLDPSLLRDPVSSAPVKGKEAKGSGIKLKNQCVGKEREEKR